MPQFDPAVWSPQIFWLIIAFVTLYFFMSKRLIPRIEAVLHDREERISSSLKRAEELSQKAEEARLAYEASLDEARAAAHSQSREAREAAASMATAQHEALGKRLTQQIADSEARIFKARDEAVAGLQTMAVELTGGACERLLGEPVEPAKVASSVDAAMKETQ